MSQANGIFSSAFEDWNFVTVEEKHIGQKMTNGKWILLYLLLRIILSESANVNGKLMLLLLSKSVDGNGKNGKWINRLIIMQLKNVFLKINQLEDYIAWFFIIILFFIYNIIYYYIIFYFYIRE